MAAICLYTSVWDLDTVCVDLSQSITLTCYDAWKIFCKHLGLDYYPPKSCFGDEFYNALVELLTKWANTKQETATLQALVDILVSCGLWQESEALRETFSLPPKHAILPVVPLSAGELRRLRGHVSNYCASLCDDTDITSRF